jgi:hypothetical protein
MHPTSRDRIQVVLAVPLWLQPVTEGGHAYGHFDRRKAISHPAFRSR